MDMKWLYSYCDPSDVIIEPILVPFEDIGVKSIHDCDILLSSLNQDEPYTEAINAILDFRNTIK